MQNARAACCISCMAWQAGGPGQGLSCCACVLVCCWGRPRQTFDRGGGVCDRWKGSGSGSGRVRGWDGMGMGWDVENTTSPHDTARHDMTQVWLLMACLLACLLVVPATEK
jgi:hypothetical protein